jgi:two-component system nitrogen regulation response regulator GlnG
MEEKINILIVDDEKNICWILKRLFTQKGYNVDEANSGKEALDKIEKNRYNLIFLDILIPDILGFEILDKIKSLPLSPPVIIMTAQSTMKNAVEAMKRGAFEYITKPFELNDIELLTSKALESYNRIIAQKENKPIKKSDKSEEEEFTIVGKSQAINNVFKIIGKVANSDVTVLIQGERGTGKELVARAIHYNSNRSKNPFISVNCAAIPKELLESELFGHEKGAFTGAVERKIGKFELAHTGTLFLDEIGDMSIELQAKILRVLEEKEIVPVGGTKPVKVDVRIVAATNQDLIELIRNKMFRADLYDRLNQIPIFLPPLRERLEDIPLLVKHFLAKFSNEIGVKKTITEDALNFLKSYEWPGNVRELQNTIRRAFIISPNNVLDKQDFLFMIKVMPKEDMIHELSLEEIIDWKLKEFIKIIQSGEMENVYDFVISQVEKPLIKKVLEMTRGNQIKAAKVLGINRNTLRKKIKELNLNSKEFRSRKLNYKRKEK